MPQGVLIPLFSAVRYCFLLCAGAKQVGSKLEGCLCFFATCLRCAQKGENHTVSDYETLAELEYAFIVWRTNLKRDLSLTEDRGVRRFRRPCLFACK